jgi:hypothetical protein
MIKTDKGYFKISRPELPFLDLIYFEQTVSGFNQTATILQELFMNGKNLLTGNQAYELVRTELIERL